MLLCPFSSVMVPGVGDLLPEPDFPLLDVADDGAVVGAAPAAGNGGGAGQSQPFAAIALEDDITRMPLVGLAERDLAALVVRLDALDDPCHFLKPLPTARGSPRAACPCYRYRPRDEWWRKRDGAS